MPWIVETLNDAVGQELRALPADMLARFAHICGLISAVGLDRMGPRTSGTSTARFGKCVSGAAVAFRGRST